MIILGDVRRSVKSEERDAGRTPVSRYLDAGQ